MSVWARLQSQGKEEWALEFFSNKKAKYTVGRHPSCSLVLEGICVSSKHLSIYQRYAPDGSREVVVEDSSTNGSWIDGVRLSRGAIVPLKHGSVIQFPTDDDQCDNYTFKFIVHDELQSSAYQEPDEEQRREELKELETLQDQLAVDTSRLAASIFSNDATLRSLGALAKRSQKQQAENRDLRQINRDLVSIIESMVTSMRQVEENVLTTKELEPNDQRRILGALKVDRFQLVLDELQTGAENRTVVETDVETDTDEPTRRRLSTQSSVDTNVDAM